MYVFFIPSALIFLYKNPTFLEQLFHAKTCPWSPVTFSTLFSARLYCSKREKKRDVASYQAEKKRGRAEEW